MRRTVNKDLRLGYINLASQLEEAVANMPVPKVLRKEEPKPDQPNEPTK